MMDAKAETPFKAVVNGNGGIVIIREESLSVDFAKFKKLLDIPLGTIRCVQCWKNTILINAERDGHLVAYAIKSSNAKKIHGILLDMLVPRA